MKIVFIVLAAICAGSGGPSYRLALRLAGHMASRSPRHRPHLRFYVPMCRSDTLYRHDRPADAHFLHHTDKIVPALEKVDDTARP